MKLAALGPRTMSKSYFRIDLPAAAFSASLRIERVEPTTRKALREHVERFARYFLREMHFNGLQFEAAESPQSVGYVPYRAFLFSLQGRYIGAGCFRLRDDQDPVVPWLFDWLWLHPYVRRKGHLSCAWPELIKAFDAPDPGTEPGSLGDDDRRPFRLAKPISPAMTGFLERIAWNEL